MARFYVDLTLWFSADITDDDELARIYPDIATRMKGKYGVQAFNLRQAPVATQEELIPEEQQYIEEEPQPQPQPQAQPQPEPQPEAVVPTTPPPKQAKQPPLEEEEDEYEEVEEEQ